MEFKMTKGTPCSGQLPVDTFVSIHKLEFIVPGYISGLLLAFSQCHPPPFTAVTSSLFVAIIHDCKYRPQLAVRSYR